MKTSHLTFGYWFTIGCQHFLKNLILITNVTNDVAQINIYKCQSSLLPYSEENEL